MPNDIDQVLGQKTWAVVGVSNNTTKYGYKVFNQLKKAGYSVFAINPGLNSIDGDPCYPSLTALPKKPDAVSIVVPPKITEQIIGECASLGISNVWMQPGSESKRAIEEGKRQGITVIHSHCVLIHTRK
ncbi:CoA-binding protein [Desulfosporosinus meridiei]|uniref:Putative CoA-binding protein n=1 Tax=Desulfosporosinus meridiei (strain ATCC BAA-275 / DSM 13257 / KCTC 12902 / NCIMB 13706 / S10) TaxID=768704 RepID=J7IKA5_DESMD|nr:CoA-binding protein [Desulfosporosinus meridiei]AFQ42202.1 putative CoA-binding protein [Desulfosporosinus meridiei DSM 13257]